MRANCLSKAFLIALVGCLGAATLLASPGLAQPSVILAEPARVASFNDASSLLQRLQADALEVRFEADHLHAFGNEPFLIGWQAYGVLLNQARANVTDMDTVLYRLRLNQGTYTPWQRNLIARVAPTIVTLSDTTSDALATLNQNQGRIAFTNLSGLADDMYKDAGLIGHRIQSYDKYEDARREVRELGQSLRVRTNG